MAYKRFDIVVRVFNRLPQLKLKVFGTGPEAEKLKMIANENIEFMGGVSDEEKIKLFSDSIAFIHPQVEDFGITPVESMAAGRPVIAFAAGGATETVIEGKTGTFFREQSWESLLETLLSFDPGAYNAQELAAHAAQFGKVQFQERIKKMVEESWEEHQRGLRQPHLL
jgi:glycosyltransferase involved in cell wall biosynthesis